MRLDWRKREVSRVVQDLALLGREVIEAPRGDCPLASVGRHRTQSLYGIAYGLLTFRRQAAELGIHRTELLLLCARQVLPGFHAPQNLLLALGRETVEVLQPLLELLLALRRQPAESWIILQRPALLLQRLVTVLVKPLPGMAALRGRLVRPGDLIFTLRFGPVLCARFRPA